VSLENLQIFGVFMSFLDRLLEIELNSVFFKSYKANFFISILAAVIFSWVALGVDDKTLICIFSGCLLFWERYLLMRLKFMNKKRVRA